MGKDFAKIIYVYGGDSEYTRSFISELKAHFPGAEHYKGMVDIAIDDKLGDTLLIYDDLHTKASARNATKLSIGSQASLQVYESEEMMQLFSQKSRHHRISVCVTQQSPFPGGRHYGNCEINMTHR